MVAPNYALRHLAHVAAIVLADTAPAARGSDIQIATQFGNYTRETADLKPWWSLLAPMLYSDAYREAVPPELAATRGQFVSAVRAGLAGLFGAVAHRPDITSKLSDAHRRLLFLAH